MTVELREQKEPKKYKLKRIAIFSALQQEDTELLNYIIEHLDDRLEDALTKPNQDGLSPLLFSLSIGFYEGFCILAKKLSTNSPAFFIDDSNGNNYLHYLARKGLHKQLKSVFTRHHMPLLLKQNNSGRTPLLEACLSASQENNQLYETVNFLLEQGSFVHHSDFSNVTALQILLSRMQDSSPKPDIERTIVILSHFGAILCQRFSDLNAWRKLKDQHEMLVYGSFFGDSEADKTFSNSLCRLSDLENFIEILQKKKLSAKPQQQRIFKNQLKNLGYALKIFSFAPESKNFGQTFFKPSFRPRLPELDNFPVAAIKPYDENDTIFKASTLHNMSLFWLFQCYKELQALHPAAKFIKHNTIWSMLVFGVAWGATFVAMMIDNAVRKFSIPGFRDGIELAPAIQDAVNDANGKTIPYFIAIGILFVGAFAAWIPYLWVKNSEKNRDRVLVKGNPNLLAIEQLLNELKDFVPNFTQVKQKWANIESVEEVENFTETTAKIVKNVSKSAGTDTNSEVTIKLS